VAASSADDRGARKGILVSAIKELTEMKANGGLSSANEWHLVELTRRLLDMNNGRK